jgi:superfamily II DNA or RNA helicase
MPTVKAIISNNIKLLNPPTPLRLKITGALVLKNPVYEDRLKRRLPTWGMESRIEMYSNDAGGNVLIPRGFFEEFDRLCKEAGYTVEYDVQTVKGVPVDFGWNTDIKLRDYQNKALNDLTRNGVLVAPAGSGKTTIGMRYISEGRRAALWIVHTEELMDQAAKTAERVLPRVGKVGRIGAGVCNYGDHKLIVAMVQTLHERPEIVEKLNDYIGTVVFDECHHFPATMFLELGSQLKASWVLGLTATPDRKDKLEKLM